MFFYYGKRFDTAQTGGTIVGVQCDKCGCEYYYELVRIGKGAADAVYGIGAGAAQASAEAKSGRDLQERLASEAELVPCPKCNWINDGLVQGYRQGRFRGVGKFTLFVGIGVIALALVFAWYFSIGAPQDRYLAPYFVFGALSAVVVFAAATFGLRAWLRQRIQPNRAFPQPPVLPLGTPPALFGDPTKSEFWPAKSEADIGEWLEFQIGRNRFPLVCCDCLQPATTEHAVQIHLDDATALEIPRCAACAQKSQSNPTWTWLFFGAVVALAGGMTLTFMYGPQEWSTCISMGMLLVFFAAVAMIATAFKLPSPVEAKIVDRSRGVVRVRFLNAAYTQLAAKHAQDSYKNNPDSSAKPAPEVTGIQAQPIAKVSKAK